MSRPASVTSLAARPGWRANYASISSGQVRAARESLHLDYEGFAAWLSGKVGWGVTPGAVARWEAGENVPPGDVLLACDSDAPAAGLLTGVPHSFSADTLQGAWVTSYQFSQPPKCHADIAHLQVISDRRVRVTNFPPSPRTQGHVSPYLNLIEAELANRHLIGYWKNTSDARYFGAIHLSVLPGEMVMEGHYTNFVDDVRVSTGFWKWVRVDPGSIAGADLAAVTLRDPAELHALLEQHTQYDAPLSLTDLREVA